ncbi:LuxR family transcriptional regulator [Sphingosinicella sp. BN140058]|uniref:helix-turn-helix transcriptional regulator n=1 Tax=Sphingosinicella sp. BN140058 TaxID=1892855 RepID=UPI001012B544|nr:LuxR family transcriptional regulator [Sphingosinicella sp. BN140058]QAY78325.1 LuxR family transcriptional regulator [Sphingosinicella sp. BN140058]
MRGPRALESLLGDVARQMGFDHFALMHHVDLAPYRTGLDHMERGEMVAISDYPSAWIEEYVRRNIVADDPVLLASRHSIVGFAWDRMPDLITLTMEHRALMEDTHRAGIGDGYTVPAHIPGEAAGSCTFATRTGRALPVHNLAMAQLVGAYAFQAARTMVINARRHPAAQPPRPRLTDRQLQCTVMVGRGMTEREIARRLGISDETVKRHLKEARQVYEVSKSIELVTRALHDGQISLFDLVRD